ncbi:MAG TPA: hypothetical protein PKN75_01095 [Bacteroidia bacterium]|nr:hypothetical protein [Bacteroidia bacterium]HNU32168.1 hypothetical protein [Bacteroidia bacterium]
MSSEQQDLIVYASALSVILPISAGLLCFSKLTPLAKSFIPFLVLGGCVDAISILIESNATNILLNIYRLTEVIFYTWFIIKVLGNAFLNKYSGKFFLSILIVYLATHFLVIKNYNLIALNAYFDFVSFMMLSFLSAFTILKSTEYDNKQNIKSYFYFLTGIFIYVFCTNILFGTIANDEIRDEYWFVHNLLNILAMLIYTVAFVKSSIKIKTELFNSAS